MFLVIISAFFDRELRSRGLRNRKGCDGDGDSDGDGSTVRSITYVRQARAYKS